MSFASTLKSHGISMSEEEELAVQSWIADPSEELASRLSTTTLFGMLEVCHTNLMDAFQSFQRLDFWAYRTTRTLHLEPYPVAFFKMKELVRLGAVTGRLEREIACQTRRRRRFMSVLAKRKLTYGEKIKLKVEVMRMKVKLRKETAAMMDLKEMFRIELTMAGSRIDSRDWRRTAEALRARIGGHRINNVMYWFWIQVNKLLPSHIFA